MPADRVARIAFRLVFLVLAASGLTWVCRQGTSLLTVGLVFVVYVVAATLWVRGQYQAWVDATVLGDESRRPWTFGYRTSGIAGAAGVVVALAGAALDNSTALLAGVLTTYLASGYLLMRFRMYAGDGARRRVQAGAWVLGGAVVLTIVGLLALEDSTWGAILVASVLFAAW